MPRQAFDTQEFIKRGTFLTAQYFSEESAWRNISWGPTAVFFYAFFLKISSNPLTVSYLLSILNLLSVGLMIILVWRYFSKTAAIIVGFLLAANPYWLTYSRLIYTPSPLTFFIPISMFLFFESTYKKKVWAIALLPVSWVALIQIYLPTYSFILTSFVAFLFFFKSVNVKHLVIGIMLSLILLLPTINFYMNKTEYIQRIINAPSLFTPPEKSIMERFSKIVFSFIQIPVGGRFELQTGNSNSDFVNNYLFVYPFASLALSALFAFSLIWNLYKGLSKKEYKRLIIFFWAIAPVWSMMVLWVTDIVPRYYLIAFPAAAILIALTLRDLICLSKVFWAIPVLIIFYFVLFDLSFDRFISNYNYPHGRLVDVAETPFIYLNQAINWTINDANRNKCNVVLSNNPENPDFDIWLETKYIWEYVYYRKANSNSIGATPCHYIITYRNNIQQSGVNNYEIFGPFAAYRGN